MAYPKRDWANTGNEVTKDDFKRIENGIEANDIEITKQKNPTIPGTLAKKIADNVTAIEENANKINDCYSKKHISIGNTQDLYLLENGNYTFEGTVPSGKNYPLELVSTYQHLTIHISGTNGTGNGYKVIDISGAYGAIYKNTQRWDRWQGWQEIATTATTTIDLPYNSGYENQSSSWKSKIFKMNNMAQVRLCGRKKDSSVFNANTQYTICTLPVGYRPKENFQVSINCEKSGVETYFGWAKFYTSGDVCVYFSNNIAIRFFTLTPWYEVQ